MSKRVPFLVSVDVEMRVSVLVQVLMLLLPSEDTTLRYVHWKLVRLANRNAAVLRILKNSTRSCWMMRRSF
jgi:hypothetical protein